MNKSPIALLLSVALLSAILGSWPSSAKASGSEKPTPVLIVYDGLAKGSSRGGNLEMIQRLLAAYGAKVTFVSYDRYKSGTLQLFSNVIALRNLPDSDIGNPDFVRDFDAYGGKYLHIGPDLPLQAQRQLQAVTRPSGRNSAQLAIGPFSQTIRVEDMPYIASASGDPYGSLTFGDGDGQAPYAVKNGRFAYVPFMEAGNLSGLAIAYLLKDWMFEAGEGSTYLLFKEIYPFSDLQLLTQTADKLYDAGIPFIVSVRPVFVNTDYPAMERYLEALKYVQSRNGSILVNAPVVASTVSGDDRTLPGKMERFIDVLAGHGIAPLGLGADLYWSYDRLYSDEGMRFFDSAALFASGETRYRSPADESRPFASSPYTLPLGDLQRFEHRDKSVPSLPMDTAITFDFSDDRQRMDDVIQRLLDSWITFSDFKYAPHRVHTEANDIVSHGGQLYINGTALQLSSAMKEISADYVYRQEEKQSFTAWFSVQNKIFIAAILMTFPVFGAFLFIGSRRYRRKYYH